ncbi:chaperonin 10-like protein [Ilyonectria sp. MPI-CAGE-AT-0026]|nr:chaperonin 10-like protein [Ilyonectria sp. MPI-CAGE-AT-0026]
MKKGKNLNTNWENLGTWTCYAQSKLANVLYAAEVARRYPKITAVSLHPGIVGTGLVEDLGFFSKALVYIGAGFRPKSPEDGARNGLWVATTSLNNIRSRAYYEPVGKEVKLNSTARDEDLAKRLWDWTEEQLKALDIQAARHSQKKARTMKVYRFTSPSKGLEYTELPVPVPEKNQIIIEVKATGFCHTDQNIISGNDDTFFWKRPITLGHEIAGVVVSVGSDVSDVTTSAGIGYDGGFAQYAALFETKALHVPEEVTLAQAAVATDAIATVYHAVIVEAQVTASSKVAIVGLGGYLPGAQAGILASVKSFDGFPGVRFDAVVDCVGTGSTTAAAVKAVKSGGKVVLVGLSAKEVTLNTHEFVALGVSLKGSAGSSIQEVEKCLQMITDKEIEPLLEEIPFSRIKEGIDRLAQGDVIGRLYADPTKA